MCAVAGGAADSGSREPGAATRPGARPEPWSTGRWDGAVRLRGRRARPPQRPPGWARGRRRPGRARAQAHQDLRRPDRRSTTLDLEVHRGEVFALLGPNGAGKTTTVEILEGDRRRTSGEVRVLGGDPFGAGEDWRARVGVVLQASAELRPLTVAEVVHHFAAVLPRPADPDVVIDQVGLDEKRATRTTTLSGGQRRRLDVALAIVGRPELLFLDEPTTGFDPEARRSFWGLIGGLQTGARPSCSPPTTSTRPSSWPTGSA